MISKGVDDRKVMKERHDKEIGELLAQMQQIQNEQHEKEMEQLQQDVNLHPTGCEFVFILSACCACVVYS